MDKMFKKRDKKAFVKKEIKGVSEKKDDGDGTVNFMHTHEKKSKKVGDKRRLGFKKDEDKKVSS